MYWFHVPDLLMQGADRVALPEDQAHHAASVLRLVAGEEVVLFDGAGRRAQAVITVVSKRAVTLRLKDALAIEPAPRPELVIATAVPKADRAEWLVEQASQLNVSRLVWLTTERGVVKPKEGSAKLEKHARLAIESAKQCHRTHVMHVTPPTGIEEVLRQAEGTRVLWLDPGERSRSVQEVMAGTQAERIVALVGPEGGWSEREVQLLEGMAAAGKVTRMRMTATVLRIETAAAAIAAVVMSR